MGKQIYSVKEREEAVLRLQVYLSDPFPLFPSTTISPLFLLLLITQLNIERFPVHIFNVHFIP